LPVIFLAELDEDILVTDDRCDELLSVHEALDELERHDAQAAAVVKLRFFAGVEQREAADVLGFQVAGFASSL